MLRLLPLLLACAVLLTGCVEVEEAWTLDDKGGGTFDLRVRWDADLWRRVSEVLGPRVMGRLSGPSFPLRSAQWRDGLRHLKGVDILELEEGDAGDGRRQIATKLKFGHLRDLLAWEVLARRSTRVELEAGKPGEPRHCRLRMQPLVRVPVLDPLAALLNAEEKPPAAAEGAAAPRDPPPLDRLGLERAAAEMVWRMLKLPLAKAKLTFQFRAPGDVTHARGKGAGQARRSVDFSYDFASLRKAETDRSLDFTWRVLEFDEPPLLRHQGDRVRRKGGVHGRKR